MIGGSMNLIDRNYCVISGQKDLEPLYSFANFPVFMGCLDQPAEDDIKVDMNWWIRVSVHWVTWTVIIWLHLIWMKRARS